MESLKRRVYLFTLLGLLTVTGFALVGVGLLEYMIHDQQKIHEISVVTSNQSMLVQRIAFLSERLARAKGDAEFEDVKQRYNEAVNALEASFDDLESWIRLNDDSNKTVQSIYAQSNIRDELRQYLVTAKERVATDSSWQSLRSNAGYLARQGRSELADLTDSIRAQVLKTRQNMTSELKWIVVGVLGLMLFSVFLVWLFVLRPMLRTILTQQLDLARDRKELQEKNQVLRASQQELEVAKQEAESANRAKTEFLANISHEIRTPMTAILGYADIYLSEGQTKVERENTVLIIRKNAEELMRLIDDILDVSKIEARELKIEKIPIELQKILSEVHALMKVKAINKGIVLDLEFSGKLPKYVCTDPVRLRQVLFNIIGNAIKFTKVGSVRVVTDYVAGEGEQGLVRFCIHDTGFGIPAEQRDRIFQPFVQLDASATRNYGGAGLGLALSKDISRLLGGNLELLNTTPNAGSTFVVTIDPGPVRKDQLVNVEWNESIEENDEYKIGRSDLLKGYYILVVDDSPDIRELLKVYLRAAGATVITAQDGEDALKKVMHDKFDLILCDLQMPKRDGYQTVSELRRLQFKMPVLALTAHAMQEERRRCLSVGFDDHLIKPISARKLVNSLSSHLKPRPVPKVEIRLDQRQNLKEQISLGTGE